MTDDVAPVRPVLPVRVARPGSGRPVRLRRTAVAAVALAAAGGLAACSSSTSTSTGTSTTTAASASPSTGGATAGSTAGATAKVSANTASAEEIQAALTAAGVTNAARWTKEVQEYRPYPADDPSLAKLRKELQKYNPSADQLDKILSALQP